MIRTVSADSVISSIRRISKENYDIYIVGSSISSVSSEFEDYYVTLKSSPGDTDLYLSEVLYNYGYTASSYDALHLTITGNGYKYITNSKIEKIYSAIKNETFYEFIGIWQSGSDVSDANKTTYRIITYVQT